MNRNVGIALTVFTVLCCACPGLGMCIFGGLIAAGQPVTTTVNGLESVQTYPPTYGIGLICLSVILIIIPIAVGFFAFRKKPAPVAGQVPPAS